jgi:hypothetical protein
MHLRRRDRRAVPFELAGGTGVGCHGAGIAEVNAARTVESMQVCVMAPQTTSSAPAARHNTSAS